MRSNHFLLGLVLLCSLAAFAQSEPQSGVAPKQTAKTVANTSQQHENEGERIFQENCSRCHNAPDGFSPHISGTIVTHMRVRANLSQHDAHELQRFFNP
jgi:cytochrome c5